MNDSVRRSMEKNSIQLKIGVLMILAVILLSATCYLLYRNLSLIVSSIRIDDNPELRLLSIRDISTDLEKAGNSVRIYTITREPSDIKPYYTVISNIDEKVGALRTACRNDSVLLLQTDTISRLIEENIIIWNKLLALYKDDQVTDYLGQLSDQLSIASENNQKKGILKRVFSRTPENPLDEQAIADSLTKVVEQDRTTKGKLITQESQLAAKSSEIRKKFYDLMTKMENEVYDLIERKAVAANQIAGTTYRWLVMLSISGGLLAILVLFIIIRFVRKAYSYQLALENSKNEAEKLARTKELFMANMSHEIRTPVTAISGFTDQLLQESLSDETRRSLKIIKSSSDHLLKIIDDILDFSKLQNNKLVLEKVDFRISQILEDVYDLFENKARENNIRLSYSISQDTPPVLLGDPYRLKQIMINLVSNAVKFTKNGTVSFAVNSFKKHWDEIDLILECKDTGIGIDESKLKIIFEDFTQAEMSTTRKYGGTGLGLSIVKKLVEMQHGTIDFKSRKNQGTEIICRIPYLTGDEKHLKTDTVKPASLPQGISGLKILIVDDEEYNRLLFRKILSRWNVKCSEAVNGMDALELLKEEQFDLLFMDIRMPGIDGVNATQFIREEMKIPESDMPVVFVSAAQMNDDMQKYRKAGMNAFLQKPFTEEMLMTTILAVLGNDNAVALPGSGESEIIKPAGENKIDLQNLYHISGGDGQFVKQMLLSFINTTRIGLSEMQEAVGSGNNESVANLAHKLLSPCRHIGAMDLYNLLNEIEKGIRTNIFNGPLETLIGKSVIEFESVSKHLSEHIAKMN
jgi:signal transduction histidine kinase/CheY-like chemotaxis protein/HPt (histidine-containing phosphotransfer) domain-containing protein